MRRPLFVLALFALVACSAAADESGLQAGASSADPKQTTLEARPSTTTLRVVASNLTSGNLQSYDPGEGARILAALKPDITLMQEFNFGNDSPEALTSFVHATFGEEFTYSRESGNAQIPNGVVSRYPIVQNGQWTDPQTATRSFAWARIDIPGDKDLWAISVHLLTSGASRRQAEAAALVQRIRAEVPANDYLVLGGDFNTTSRTETCIRTFGAVLDVAGPFPVDARGNGDTNAGRNDPYDWVLVGPSLTALEVPAVVGGIAFEHGTVFDSRSFNPLEKVAPVRRSDSAATNMQHMAVVRDFALPVPPVVVEKPIVVEPANADAGATEPPVTEADASTH